MARDLRLDFGDIHRWPIDRTVQGNGVHGRMMPNTTVLERMSAIDGSPHGRASLVWLAFTVSLACAIVLPSKTTAESKKTAVAATARTSEIRLYDSPNAFALFGELRLPARVIVISMNALDDVNRMMLLFQSGGDMDDRIVPLLLYPAVPTPMHNDPVGDYSMSQSSLAFVTPPTVYDKKVLFLYMGKGPIELTLLSSTGQPLVTITGARSPLSKRRYGGEIHFVDRIHMIGHVDIAETILSLFHHHDVELTSIPIFRNNLFLCPLMSNTVRYSLQHGAAMSMEFGIMLKLHVHDLERAMFLGVSLGPEVHFDGRVGTALNAVFNVPI